MTSLPATPLDRLLEQGVSMPHPASVYVAPEVRPERIHASAVLRPGSRLLGENLWIGPGCDIGGETPATVEDCRLEAGVALKGGVYQGSVFLRGSSAGSSAHIRPGCLLEEEASVAHAVGLKQTILLPFVTLGSLVNFCDALMAGGTGRKDHSEVGSSFIHFNFTPHGDKATASLIGDVARGVLLDRKPIFLGGQGGVVGPVEMDYGVVQAAGSVCRRDLDEPDHLYRSASGKELWTPYRTGRISDPERKLRLNLAYIGNLSALKLWYREVRRAWMAGDPFREACVEGALDLLDGALAERRKRLEFWLEMAEADAVRRKALLERLDGALAAGPAAEGLRPLREAETSNAPYVDRVNGISDVVKPGVVDCLQHEINRFVRLADPPAQET